VKTILTRRSVRNEAQMRFSPPRGSAREMASIPGIFLGLLQLFNRITAMLASVKIKRSSLGSCSTSRKSRGTSPAASRHPVNARSFTTLARSLSILGALECLQCVSTNRKAISSAAAPNQTSVLWGCFHNRTWLPLPHGDGRHRPSFASARRPFRRPRLTHLSASGFSASNGWAVC
jgi:hypothetical protein